jgi:hypothetical protein
VAVAAAAAVAAIDGVLRPTRTNADRATSAPAARPKRPIPCIAVQPIFQDRGKISSNCEPITAVEIKFRGVIRDGDSPGLNASR